MKPTNESPVVLAGAAHEHLAASVAEALDVRVGAYAVQRFPDGEMYVAVGPEIEGRDVVIVQPTGGATGEHLLELRLLADACRHARARSVTAVVPYMAYARQDHRTSPRQSLGMRVVADLFAAEFARLVVVDMHASALETAFAVPLVHLSAAPLLAEAMRSTVRRSVVVAPDLGAVKLAKTYASALNLPLAIVHKTRMSPTEVVAERVIGDVRGFEPLIVDDMISTGGTIATAADALLAQGCAPNVRAVATHGVLVQGAAERMLAHGVSELVISDTLPAPQLPAAIRARIVGVAPLLAQALRPGW
jgi:ribose-phosphate pyrophosphokinase